MIIETNNIPRGVTPTMLMVMIAIEENKGTTLSGLAKSLRCSTANVTGLTLRGAEQGFLKFEDKPGDRRATLVSVTENGKKILRVISPEGVQP